MRGQRTPARERVVDARGDARDHAVAVESEFQEDPWGEGVRLRVEAEQQVLGSDPGVAERCRSRRGVLLHESPGALGVPLPADRLGPLPGEALLHRLLGDTEGAADLGPRVTGAPGAVDVVREHGVALLAQPLRAERSCLEQRQRLVARRRGLHFGDEVVERGHPSTLR